MQNWPHKKGLDNVLHEIGMGIEQSLYILIEFVAINSFILLLSFCLILYLKIHISIIKH